MKSKRTYKKEKLAKIYDDEILPIWSQRFGRMLLRDLVLPPKAMVLDVGCGTGYPALQVMRRLDDHGRIIAIDSSSAMLDVARKKAGNLAGKRIFFRTEWVEPKLSFANDVYDLVISNLGIPEMVDPEITLREFARVTKPGGRIMATLPLTGTFEEFFAVFRDVLSEQKQTAALERLEAWLAIQPSAALVKGWFERSSLLDVNVEIEHFNLLFRSSREFFFTPLIEYYFLEGWKEIVGEGPVLQEVFGRLKETMDARLQGSSFNVTVVAACVQARKASEDEQQAARERADDEDRKTAQFEFAEDAFDGPDTDGDGHPPESLLDLLDTDGKGQKTKS